MATERLAQFEHEVLLAILRLGGEAYSVPLVLELEARTGREIAQAAVFIALRRLEDKGLLISRFDDTALAETGRVRRYFRPTREALRRLREARRTLRSLWEGLEPMLDRG